MSPRPLPRFTLRSEDLPRLTVRRPTRPDRTTSARKSWLGMLLPVSALPMLAGIGAAAACRVVVVVLPTPDDSGSGPGVSQVAARPAAQAAAVPVPQPEHPEDLLGPDPAPTGTPSPSPSSSRPGRRPADGRPPAAGPDRGEDGTIVIIVLPDGTVRRMDVSGTAPTPGAAANLP